jgi:hypothetical protein
MKKIKLTQGKVALVDDEDYDWLNQWKWFAKRDEHRFYVETHDKNDHSKHLRMHRVITNCPSNMVVDHIDGNGLNNQKDNLRICTNRQNCKNRRINKNNKSGYCGVDLDKNLYDKGYKNYWRVRIRVKDRESYIGHFNTKKKAALAYNEAAKKYFGDFARLNIIK